MRTEDPLDELKRLKQENRRLSEAEDDLSRLRTMLDLIPQTLTRVDAEGNILYTNQNGYKAFGYTEEDFARGVNVFQMIAEEDLPAAMLGFEAGAKTGQAADREYRLQRKDGTTFPALISTNPIFEEDRFGGFYAVVTDLSSQKETEDRLKISREELHRSQALLQAAIEQTPSGVFIANAGTGEIFMANKAAESVLRQLPETRHSLTALQEQKLAWRVLYPNGTPMSAARFPIVRTLTGGEAVKNQEIILRMPDKEERWLLVSSAPIHDAGQRLVAGVCVFTDITELKKAEHDQQKIQKLESLGLLAGGLAHDFNNILTALVGNLSLILLDMMEEHELFPLLKEMETAASRAQELTGQLLTFAKGGSPIKETALLAEVIRQSSQFILHGSRVSGTFRFPEELWPVELDRGQFSQVIQNLVLNAIEAMPTGGQIDFSAENILLKDCEQGNLPGGRYVHVVVSDQGQGIPEENLDKIFDPYFSTKKNGSGLGLSIAFSVMRKHAGHIRAVSGPGPGTDFHLYLPALPRTMLPVSDEAPKTAQRFKGRVMIMDDEPIPRHIMERMLRRLGLETVTASEGAEAIRRLEETRARDESFDFVILDLTVQEGMGGLEAFRRLKEIDPGIKAIVCSGYFHDPVMSEYRTLGFSGRLKKPYTLETLTMLVQDMMDAGECRDEI